MHVSFSFADSVLQILGVDPYDRHSARQLQLSQTTDCPLDFTAHGFADERLLVDPFDFFTNDVNGTPLVGSQLF